MERNTDTQTSLPAQVSFSTLHREFGSIWAGTGTSATYHCLEPSKTEYALGDASQLPLSTSKASAVQSEYSLQNNHPAPTYYPINTAHERYSFGVGGSSTPTDMSLTPIPTSTTATSPPTINDICSAKITNTIRCFAHGCGGRSFSSVGNYRRHLREKNQRAKTFPCKICGRIFTRSTARNLHQKTTKCLDRVLDFDLDIREIEQGFAVVGEGLGWQTRVSVEEKHWI